MKSAGSRLEVGNHELHDSDITKVAYPLVMTNIAMENWNMALIEIDGLLIKNGWIFPWLC